MNLEIVSQALSEMNAQNAPQGLLGASMATLSALDMANMIDIFSTVFGFIGFIGGAALTYYALKNARHKDNQNDIKTERDQLELEMYRRQLQDMAQKG